jgi:hypothetical protein
MQHNNAHTADHIEAIADAWLNLNTHFVLAFFEQQFLPVLSDVVR